MDKPSFKTTLHIPTQIELEESDLCFNMCAPLPDRKNFSFG